MSEVGRYKTIRKLKDAQVFLLDMDGTVYLDNTLLSGAKETIDALRHKGARVCFVTNNSSKSNSQYANKLNAMGIYATEQDILTSCDSAIALLRRDYYGKSVYCVGTTACLKKLDSADVRLVEENADIVLVAYDTSLTYEKLSRAVTQIAQGATYIVTHSDNVCPASPVYLPDVGSFIALIERSCGKTPDVDCGKPYSPMADLVRDRFDTPCDKIVFVGDRLYTDMRFAQEAGFVSVLVLSGETDRVMYEQSNMSLDYVLDGLGELQKYI